MTQRASNKGGSNAQQAAPTDWQHPHISAVSSLLPCRKITKQITERSGRRRRTMPARRLVYNVSSSQDHRCNRHCHCHYLPCSIASSSSSACCPLTVLKTAISTDCPADDLAVVRTWTVYAEKMMVGREKTEESRSCLLHPGRQTNRQISDNIQLQRPCPNRWYQ